MPDDLNKSSSAFLDGRQFVARQNVTAWELFQNVFAVPKIDMVIVSTDPLVAPVGSPVPVRNQKIGLKDIEFGIYFPTCPDTGDNPPIQTISEINAVYQRYTFFLAINDNVLQYPVFFNQNAQRVRSQLWMTQFPTVVHSLAMSVRQDFIDPAWAGAPVTLFATCEFYCFAE